jgi:sulfur carrier protein
MDIAVNHQVQNIPDNCSVRQLLEMVLPQSTSGIAIAVNNAIVPKTNWDHYLLQPHDQITIIRATQGG